MRLAWEREYGRPSRGDPRFEDVPLVVHIEDLMMRRHLRGQGGADDSDPVLRELREALQEGRDPFEGFVATATDDG